MPVPLVIGVFVAYSNNPIDQIPMLAACTRCCNFLRRLK
jgi:hypothetical protein